jgi:hypothetical protein
LKKPNTKKGWWSSSKCRPWVQAPVPQKKKKKKEKSHEVNIIYNFKHQKRNKNQSCEYWQSLDMGFSQIFHKN